MNINLQLKEEFNLKSEYIDNIINLIDDGNTIPFIARYRKEMTGSLDDQILREFSDRLTYLRNLEEKREMVRNSIFEQNKMTDEISKSLDESKTLTEIEDIYRPYRPKRRTRATIAKEQGLEPLADIILEQNESKSIEEIAVDFIDIEKGVEDIEGAINGAKDIIAEIVSDNATFRQYIRGITTSKGEITSKSNTDESSVYEMYYDYIELIKNIYKNGHRVLALNRGEKEKILTVKINAPVDDIIAYLDRQVIINDSTTKRYLVDAIADSYKRLIAPSIDTEIRNDLTDTAQEGAIKVFGENLRQLLMQPPIKEKVVLALDPAFRTGVKFAILNEFGKVLETGVVYPTAPKNDIEGAKKKLKPLIDKHKVTIVAIGNGTASRETELFTVEMIKEIEREIFYIIVNEAGASVYSASKLGAQEFPDYDVALRSAVSIGRRLQDPLSELVKIDPKSIGVGQYQHDMNQTRLSDTLKGVVESSVNTVGVDLNTASPALLSYVSGVSSAVAKNIIIYREENGEFKTRKELLKVPKLGPKAFLQCAGFLRIQESKNPLDNTAVHPESYDTAKEILSELGYTLNDLKDRKIENIKVTNIKSLSDKLGVGEVTINDIISELHKPNRDPRDEAGAPILRADVLDMKDLKEGMILKGTVRNVIDFGAFIDIGVHQDGLVHISQMTDKFIKHPLEVLSVSDIVTVKVLSVDVDKKRIALTMKGIN